MKIGIIGAGQIGAALIRQYSKAGHEVKMTNASGIKKLKGLADETGAKAVSLAEVLIDVEVVVISIPLLEIPKLSISIGQIIPVDTVLVDTTNYYPIRDGKIDELESAMPESVWISNQLLRPVVKVYNSIFAESLAQSGLPKNAASRIALPISGDDQQAKSLVANLVNDSGFDALDIGNLQDSWRQQPGSPIYCTDLNLSQLKRNVPAAKRELLPQRRDLGLQFILQQKPGLEMDGWKARVTNNRKIYETDLGQ